VKIDLESPFEYTWLTYWLQKYLAAGLLAVRYMNQLADGLKGKGGMGGKHSFFSQQTEINLMGSKREFCTFSVIWSFYPPDECL